MGFYILEKGTVRRNRWSLKPAESQQIISATCGTLFEGATSKEAADLAVVDESSPVYGLSVEEARYGDIVIFEVYKGCRGSSIIKGAKDSYPKDKKTAFSEYLSGQWYDAGAVNTIKMCKTNDTKRGFYKRSGLWGVLRRMSEHAAYPGDHISAVVEQIKSNMEKDPAVIKKLGSFSMLLCQETLEVRQYSNPIRNIIDEIVNRVFGEGYSDSRRTTAELSVDPRAVYCVNRYLKKVVNHKEPHECFYYWNVLPFAWFLKHWKPGLRLTPISYAVYDTLYWENPDRIESVMAPLWKSISPKLRAEMSKEVIIHGKKKP